ncbi:MAG: efflux RND transporter permease subunit [Bifidobacteriaceae bacterium]|nr:efflux RND transporter permease subunit [Bifidobacteriaceae bacterium]
MFKLTELSMRHRAVVALISIAIMVGGWAAVSGLQQEMIPSVEMPMALVTATNDGVSADLMEQQLADHIEGAIESVPGARSVSTTSVNSALYAQVQFQYGTNIDTASEKLSTAMMRVARLLPDEVDTAVMTGSMEDLPVINLAIRGDDPDALDHMVNDVLEPRLSRLENVRSVTVTGFQPDEAVITPRSEDLAAKGVAMDRVNSVLADNGVAISAGSVTEGDLTLSVQTGGAIESLEALGELLLGKTPDGEAVTLADVADVVQRPQETNSRSRLDGEMAVSLSVTKTPQGNTVDVSHAVVEVLESLQAAFDQAGLRAGIVFDQGPFIESSITGLVEEGLLGLGFAVLVILLFLGSARATLVSAVSIPLSLLMAFVGLSWTGETLNILTLAAITMAIGRVVDDSIVVIENIKRHLSYGEEKKRAILSAVKEVGGAVASSTFCTAAVFVPLGFIGGMVGELFRPFGPTVAIALCASLLVALTIVPVLAYWFVQAPVAIDQADQAQQREQAEARERRSIWQRLYIPTLRGALRHPVVTLSAAAAVLVGTGFLVPTLETNFLGDIGGNTITVNQTFRAGVSLGAQDLQVQATEEAIAEVDGVESVLARFGAGGVTMMSFSAEPLALYYVSLEDDADTASVVRAVRDAVVDSQEALVGQTSVSSSESSMLVSTSVDLIVRATDSSTLVDAAAMVEKAARDTPGAIDVVNNLADDQPRVQVTVDPDKVADHGLTVTAVAALLRGLTTTTQIGSLETADQGEVPVVVSLGDGADNVDDLKALPVLTTPAGDIRLDELADIAVTDRPVSLSRMDGERSATISVTPASDDLGLLTGGLTGAIEDLELPVGATVEVAGVAAEMDQAFADLAAALAIAILIVFILMVATFGSMLQPFILLIAIPFAATGALVTLVATDTPMGVPAFIGLLLLVGIVVANAIVLIDLTNQYRRANLPLDQAIEEGARKRLRPILMTAAATVFALIPMAVGWTGGGGSFISRPLALVVIGGLATSTALTLVVVPVLYRFEALAHDKREARREARLERRRRQRLAEREARLAALASALVGEVSPVSEPEADLSDAAPADPASPEVAAEPALAVMAEVERRLSDRLASQALAGPTGLTDLREPLAFDSAGLVALGSSTASPDADRSGSDPVAGPENMAAAAGAPHGAEATEAGDATSLDESADLDNLAKLSDLAGSDGPAWKQSGREPVGEPALSAAERARIEAEADARARTREFSLGAERAPLPRRTPVQTAGLGSARRAGAWRAGAPSSAADDWDDIYERLGIPRPEPWVPSVLALRLRRPRPEPEATAADRSARLEAPRVRKNT